MKVAVEHVFTGATGSLGVTYSSSLTMLSSLYKQYTGANLGDRYVSTLPTATVNHTDVTGTTYYMPHVIRWSDNIDWVFVATNAAAAVTRTIGLYEMNRNAGTLTWKGFITLSGTTFAGTKTIQSLRACYYKHYTGTVSTSGTSTTITGNGTGFTSERIAVGARIGFGTTDPTQVSTWYDITAINSDTELVIGGDGVPLSAGTSYVIEEIRIVLLTRNATLINGGIHIMKGLNYGTFTLGGTTIPEATTVDNIRASYLLKDNRIASSNSATCTISQASPGVVTVNSHGLIAGDIVIFTTTLALPTGLVANTAYFVTSTSLTTNTFTLSATLGGAAINTTGPGSGTHTVHTGSSYQGCGLGLDEAASHTQHDVYLVHADNATNARILKFNLRASLTVAGGLSVSAFSLRTAVSVFTGTISTLNNGRVFSVSHGGASGLKSVWFVTTTRVYRCDVSSITSLSGSWMSDFMIEIPPGTTTTFTVTANFSQVDYSDSIDRLFISNALTRFGLYVSQYDSSGLVAFEKYIGANLNRVKQSTTPSGTVDGLFPQATITLWTEGGYLYAIPNSTTATLNWMMAIPVGADGKYTSTSGQRVITPKYPTTGAKKLYRIYVDHAEYIGDYTLGFAPEPYKVYFRTTGIDDNSGAWTEVGLNGDISSYSPGTHIQFMLELDTMGEVCVPTKVYAITCLYEDGSQDSHYQPSVSKSSTSTKTFAWQQVTAWGSNIPNLKLQLFDSTTNLEIFNDTVANSAYGTWEYSTNGNTWLAWNNTQDTVGNYIRYTATNFGYSGVTVRALLSQA